MSLFCTSPAIFVANSSSIFLSLKETLASVRQVLTVDRSPPTLMCAPLTYIIVSSRLPWHKLDWTCLLGCIGRDARRCVMGVGDAIAKQWGPEVTAQQVIPLIAPLLAAPSLDSTQFTTCLRCDDTVVFAVRNTTLLPQVTSEVAAGTVKNVDGALVPGCCGKC